MIFQCGPQPLLSWVQRQKIELGNHNFKDSTLTRKHLFPILKCQKNSLCNGMISKTTSSARLEVWGRKMTLLMWPWSVMMASKWIVIKWYLVSKPNIFLVLTCFKWLMWYSKRRFAFSMASWKIDLISFWL